MSTRGTPLTQVAKSHSEMATSNVEFYAARTDGRKYVKISIYNLCNQDIILTVGTNAIDRLLAGDGLVLDDIETGSALGVTPAGDPSSGAVYMTAYVDD